MSNKPGSTHPWRQYRKWDKRYVDAQTQLLMEQQAQAERQMAEESVFSEDQLIRDGGRYALGEGTFRRTAVRYDED